MFKKALGYVEKEGFVGGVAVVDFMNNKIILVDDEDNKKELAREDVELLFEAFQLHGYSVFNKDILGAVNGKMYQVELHNDGEVTLHNVNEKFEVVASGEKFDPTGTIIASLEAVMELQGSVYDLIHAMPKNPEFNVKIVKHYDGTHFTYYYACNNKEVEQIDLIKVLYMGHRLLEEEDYERNTLSYEDYMKRIADGNLKEVTPQELNNFVTGASYNDNKSNHPAPVNAEVQEEMEEVEELDSFFDEPEVDKGMNICDGCDRDLDHCLCDPWN